MSKHRGLKFVSINRKLHKTSFDHVVRTPRCDDTAKCVYVRPDVYMYVRIYIYVYVCMYICMYVCICMKITHTHTQVRTPRSDDTAKVAVMRRSKGKDGEEFTYKLTPHKGDFTEKAVLSFLQDVAVNGDVNKDTVCVGACVRVCVCVCALPSLLLPAAMCCLLALSSPAFSGRGKRERQR